MLLLPVYMVIYLSKTQIKKPKILLLSLIPKDKYSILYPKNSVIEGDTVFFFFDTTVSICSFIRDCTPEVDGVTTGAGVNLEELLMKDTFVEKIANN